MMTIQTLSQQFTQHGKLVWIGIRPKRQQPMLISNEVVADCKLSRPKRFVVISLFRESIYCH